MAVKATTVIQKWVSVPFISAAARSHSNNDTCGRRAAHMTPVSASRNNVVFFDHLFLGVIAFDIDAKMQAYVPEEYTSRPCSDGTGAYQTSTYPMYIHIHAVHKPPIFTPMYTGRGYGNGAHILRAGLGTTV